jgi:hypothetical protein
VPLTAERIDRASRGAAGTIDTKRGAIGESGIQIHILQWASLHIEALRWSDAGARGSMADAKKSEEQDRGGEEHVFRLKECDLCKRAWMDNECQAAEEPCGGPEGECQVLKCKP